MILHAESPRKGEYTLKLLVRLGQFPVVGIIAIDLGVAPGFRAAQARNIQDFIAFARRTRDSDETRR